MYPGKDALCFSPSQKYLGIFDEHTKERRVSIQPLDDIYQHADELRRVFRFYEGEKGEGKPVKEQAKSLEEGTGS